MKLHRKCQRVQNHCELGSMKYMDLLKFIIKLDIQLVLFDYSCCDIICDKIKYVISTKSGITDITNHNFTRIRIDFS